MSANARETGPRQVGSRRQQRKPTTWPCESLNVQTYISGTAFTTSVQSRSSCESNDFRAKTLSSGSGSDKKPTKPPAETSPTIVAEQGVRRQYLSHDAQTRMRMLLLGVEAPSTRGSLGEQRRAPSGRKVDWDTRVPGRQEIMNTRTESAKEIR